MVLWMAWKMERKMIWAASIKAHHKTVNNSNPKTRDKDDFGLVATYSFGFCIISDDLRYIH